MILPDQNLYVEATVKMESFMVLQNAVHLFYLTDTNSKCVSDILQCITINNRFSMVPLIFSNSFTALCVLLANV